MHKKTITAPKYWKTGKKRNKWVVCPEPGTHKKNESIPLLVLLRDVLKLGSTAREIRAALNAGKVLVDGKKRKSRKFPVGLMDVVSIPSFEKNYRVVPSFKGLSVIEIDDKEAKIKLAQVKKKTIVKGGKIQITAFDGTNFLKDASTDSTLIIDLEKNKIKEELKFKEGVLVLIIKGKHAGLTGKLKKIVEKGRYPDTIQIETQDGFIETLKKYSMVIGKKKPEVSLFGE